MPPIGLLLGNVDFSNLFLNLNGSYDTVEAATSAGAPIIKYGLFINTVIDFVIVAFVIFLVVSGINQLRKARKPRRRRPRPSGAEEQLLTEIRDLLRRTLNVGSGRR